MKSKGNWRHTVEACFLGCLIIVSLAKVLVGCGRWLWSFLG